MKKNHKSVLFLFLGLLIINSCFAFDWVQLHNQADDLQIKEVKTKIEKSPESIPELYTLALIYLNQYKNQKAKEIFAKILKIEPSNLYAQWGRIETIRRKHQCKTCRKELEQIIAAKPNFAPAYMTLAYLYYVDMKFEESAKLSYRVIKMGQSNVDQSNYIRALGLFSGAKGMIAHYGGPLSKIINGRAVMPYLKKAERIDSDSAVVYFGFGSYYLLIPPIFGRNLEKAEKYLKKSIEADPNFANTYVRLAQVYRAQGKQDKYQQYLNKALEIDPKNELALDIKTRKCDFICIN
ncbi:MAG: tetratricopeptide repeat protein [Candidatus Omnitrophica bacterium]|nr:tetratricopeptide repeat protein [Candidatus Omnitrophota bacterium]